MLCTEPVLKAPDFDRSFCLNVDASDRGIWAVLLPKGTDGQLHPVSYFSRKLNKCQKAYATIGKEAFALMSSLQHYELYITTAAAPTIVYTDHNPLTYIE